MLGTDAENPMCISAAISRSGPDLTGQVSPDCAEDVSCAPFQAAPRLEAVAKGLAHPNRLAILRLIATDGSRHTTGEIVTEIGLAQSTVSEHLRVLREAGLVLAHRDGPYVRYTAQRGVLRRFARALDELVAPETDHRDLD